MDFKIKELVWTREPSDYTINDNKIEITTKPYTDLWQRTYYNFMNDNAPVLQMETDEKYFSFIVKTEFESKHRFDQCGVVVYLDSESWIKGSIEYENENFQHLGSVVTNSCIGGAAGGALSSILNLGPKGTGASMVPGMLLYLNGGMLQYILVLAVSIGVAFAITYVVMKGKEK